MTQIKIVHPNGVYVVTPEGISAGPVESAALENGTAEVVSVVDVAGKLRPGQFAVYRFVMPEFKECALVLWGDGGLRVVWGRRSYEQTVKRLEDEGVRKTHVAVIHV